MIGAVACGGTAANVPTGPAVATNVPTTAPAGTELAIHDVRVFDGVKFVEHQTVWIGGGKILGVVAAGPISAPVPDTVVEGKGGTLMPGLIDAHAHVNSPDDPHRALTFGVTTELDMMSVPDVSVPLMRTDDQERARVFAAGYAATHRGGHGTEYGIPVPVIDDAADAKEFVAARVAEGSHHIKVILETGSELGHKIPTLDQATATAVVAEAHAQKLLAVAHVGDAADVREAIAAGVDGLMHVVPEKLDAATIAQIAQHKMFVAPTLTVVASVCSRKPGDALVRDPRIAVGLTPDDLRSLTASFTSLPDAHLDCDAPAAEVAALHAAGVRILAGTDAPNPSTAHGASLHGELALLVAAGLSPAEALAAATSAPAAAFGLDGLGTIAPGAQADLVLVDGDPSHDITQTRALRMVWRGGHAIDLAARRAAATAARDAALTQSAQLLGPIGDFARDDGAARYSPSSDDIFGGKSTAKMELSAPGQGGNPRALAVSGEVIVKPGERGFGGVRTLFSPDGKTAVDLSAAKKLRFWVRGDQADLSLMMFAGRAPSVAHFACGPQWAEVVIDLATLGARTNVLGFAWVATAPGKFAFRIDRVRLE